MTATDAGELVEELTRYESNLLGECEEIIGRDKDAFLRVGDALATIRDRKLYRATHATFAEYCAAVWDLSKRHVNRMIAATTVHELVAGTGPRGLGPTERQLRPLTQLRPAVGATPEQKAAAESKIQSAWERAVNKAKGEAPTAAEVEAAVREQVTADEAASQPGEDEDNIPDISTLPKLSTTTADAEDVSRQRLRMNPATYRAHQRGQPDGTLGAPFVERAVHGLRQQAEVIGTILKSADRVGDDVTAADRKRWSADLKFVREQLDRLEEFIRAAPGGA